jgi:hypothetical protein
LLPNFDCVRQSVEEAKEEIEMYYIINYIADPFTHPLFKATSKVEVEEKLMQCPDCITNKTQFQYLHPVYPFIQLIRREYPLCNRSSSKKRNFESLSDEMVRKYFTNFEMIVDDPKKSFTDLIYKVCNRENQLCSGIPGKSIS